MSAAPETNPAAVAPVEEVAAPVVEETSAVTEAAAPVEEAAAPAEAVSISIFSRMNKLAVIG